MLMLYCLCGESPQLQNYSTDYGALYFMMIKRNVDAMMSIPFETSVGKTIGDYVNFLNDEVNSTFTTMDKR